VQTFSKISSVAIVEGKFGSGLAFEKFVCAGAVGEIGILKKSACCPINCMMQLDILMQIIKGQRYSIVFESNRIESNRIELHRIESNRIQSNRI
jgi:N-acetylmuramic acid 6-phosphate (MurNAc-6-P) etherase